MAGKYGSSASGASNRPVPGLSMTGKGPLLPGNYSKGATAAKAASNRGRASAASTLAQHRLAVKNGTAKPGLGISSPRATGLAGALLSPSVTAPITSKIGKTVIGKNYKEGKYGLGVDLFNKYVPSLFK